MRSDCVARNPLPNLGDAIPIEDQIVFCAAPILASARRRGG